MKILDRLYWARHERQYDVAGVAGTLAAFRAATPDARRHLLAERLRDSLRHFAARPDALPEWREAARIDDLDALWRAWPSLPIVTKADLRHRFTPQALRAQGVAGQLSATGGSTGEPTTFIHDDASVRTMGALTHLTRQAVGWRPGMPTICVWGVSFMARCAA